MIKHNINYAGIYASNLRSAVSVGISFIGWFFFVFILVLFFQPPVTNSALQPVESDVCWAQTNTSKTIDSERITVSYFSSAAYLATQMMFANGDVKATCHPVLQVLRLFVSWTLPIFGLFALMSSIRIRLWLWIRKISGFLFPSSELILIIGLGTKGFEVLQSEILRNKKKSTFFAVLDINQQSTALVNAKNLGALVWIGDGLSSYDLSVICWKRPTKIWIMTSDSTVNLKILDQISSCFKNDKTSCRLDVFAHISEPELLREASSIGSLNQDRDNFWTHLINMEESAAAWLIRIHPLKVVDKKIPRVLIIGLGMSGRAILKEVLLMSHFPESNKSIGLYSIDELEKFPSSQLAELKLPEVILIDLDASFKEKIFKEMPYLKNKIEGVTPYAGVKFRELDASNLSFQDFLTIREDCDFSHIFISIGNEIKNITLAEKIFAWEKILAPARMPRIVPIIYDKSTFDWSSLISSDNEEEGGVKPYYFFDTYSARALKWFESLRIMGKAINEAYSNSKTWTEIGETDRRSSVAHARYIFNRWGSNTFDESKFSWQATPLSGTEEFEIESEVEHRRWNAFMLSENFVPLPHGMDYGRLDTEVSVRSGSLTKLRKIAKINKNIIDYQSLTENMKKIDRNLVAEHDSIKRKGVPTD